MMKCDIYEENDMYHIVVDIPGYKKEDISIEYEKGYLKIVATHKEEEKSNKKYMRRERVSTSRCERSFYLGEELNEDEIKAEFKDGILKVSVPKNDKEEPTKKIINID
ncbi:MAG: Hsp20/alpha crystallin family protein [Bacilli bacterium]